MDELELVRVEEITQHSPHILTVVARSKPVVTG